jgi:hypothetical protein
MEQNEDLSPAIEDLLAAAPNEASLRRQVTNLLLGGSRDVRLGWLTLEQRDVLQKIETALEAYGNYFYPPEHRYRGGHGSALRSQAGRVTGVLGA